VRQGAATVLLLAVVSVLFSWPLAITEEVHLSRQWDLYTLLWVIHATDSLDASLHTTLSAWPLGQHLNRADSFVLLLFARLWPGSEMSLVRLVTLTGPVLSGWAAERFAARALGASWPWSLIAGLAFAFSGLAATALLEGHVYMLFIPWLPLLGWAWVRAMGPEGRALDGFLAGLMWTLCLLTSAYIGIAASLLVVLLARRGAWAPRLTAAAVAVPAGLLYLSLFVQSGGGQRLDAGGYTIPHTEILSAGSARLGTLIGWNSDIDLFFHSLAPRLGAVILGLSLLAPVVLRRVALPWRRMLAMAILCVLLSLGSTVQFFHHDLELPWLLAPFGGLPGLSFFHFPARLLHIAVLALGAVAALVATRLHRRVGWLALPLLAMAVIDALAGSGAPLRSGRVPVHIPAAYLQAPPGAILEMFPRFNTNNGDMENYINNLTCSYQRLHNRPLLNLCIGTALRTGPRWQVSGWLFDALLDRAPDERIPDTLGALGIGSVVLHPDLFQPSDRGFLREGLVATLGEPLAESMVGEHVVLFAVPPDPAADPEAMYAAISAAEW